MDFCTAVHSLQMQLTLLSLLLVISTAMLVTILAVGAAVLACRILQGKTERSSRCPLRSPVSEQSGDTGTMVVTGTGQQYSKDTRETIQAVQQQSTDAGELVVSH